MFTTGSLNLTTAVATYNVVFGTPFTAPPQVVAAFVKNTTDVSPYQLDTLVTAVTNSGFTCQVDGTPDTSNYVLTYIAGSPEALFATIQAIGARGTSLPHMSGAMQNNNLFFGVNNSVYPVTVAYTYEYMKTLFLTQLAAIPASPSSPGEYLQMAVDADYLYIHTGVSSARIPLFKTEWGIPDLARKTQRGILDCTPSVQAQTVTFPSAFLTGDLIAPNKLHITFNIANTVDADPVQILTGVLREKTNVGCVIVLSDQPATANYQIYWEAKIIT